MPLYLSRFSYTPETWARLIGKPEDRRKAAQSTSSSTSSENGLSREICSLNAERYRPWPRNLPPATVNLCRNALQVRQTIQPVPQLSS